MPVRPVTCLFAAIGLAACSGPAPADAQIRTATAQTKATQASATTIAKGTFSDGDGHASTGGARIVTDADGSHTLVLHAAFATDGGPDLRVWLSEAPAGDGDAIADASHIDLGALDASTGGQSYAIPAGTDIAALRSAVIWCRAFGVYFGWATLESA
ncbi:MAG: DM13 domain-containing protein [Parerythrobacter sp.]